MPASSHQLHDSHTSKEWVLDITVDLFRYMEGTMTNLGWTCVCPVGGKISSGFKIMHYSVV